MSELVQLEMTLDEARETDRLIKRHINTTRYLLLDMRDRNGYLQLGYSSFKDYGEKELGYQENYMHKLVNAAEISLQIGFSQDCTIVQPPESQLRPLTQVPESVRKEIWDEATRKAEEAGKKVTAKAVSEAVEEWKQRSEDWRQQSNGQRKKIRDLESQIDLLQARPAEPVTVIPDDYEALKQTERDLRNDLADLRQKQRELVQQQVAEKLAERETELAEIDRKVSAAIARLEGLQNQIDRYTLRQRELKVHLDVIEEARTSLATLAANLSGFQEVIDDDHERRQWVALSDMMRHGAAVIDQFVSTEWKLRGKS